MSLTSDDLIRFIRDGLNIEDSIEQDTELFSSGMLDSVAMMNLIGFIEKETEIEVHPADVTLENFDTVQRIADYTSAND